MVIFSFFVLILIGGLIGGVMWLADKYSKEGGGDQMLKNVYQYLISFVTLMMVIGGSVSCFMAVADYFAPNNYYFQSFEEYKMSRQHEWDVKINPSATQEMPSDEELKKSFEEMKNDQLKQEKNRAVNQFIKSLGWIIIPFPVFLYFQRRIRQN